MFYRKATTVTVETNGMILFETYGIMSEQSLGAYCYLAGKNVILCVNKCYYVGTNVLMWEQMLLCGNKCYHAGKIFIMWE